MLLSNGIHASNNRETAQVEEIRELKEKLDAQQVRLHRMQKELQFLVTRERVSYLFLLKHLTHIFNLIRQGVRL